MKKYLWMSSAAVMIGTLRANIEFLVWKAPFQIGAAPKAKNLLWEYQILSFQSYQK